MSIDGYLGSAAPRRLELSNAADLNRVDAGRASCEAILAGAATVRIDNPRLVVRSPGGIQKLVYSATSRVLDGRSRLGKAATAADGGRRVKMRRLSEGVGERGVQRLVGEGGGTVHTQFLTDDLAPELHLVVAPFFVGDTRATRFVGDGHFPWNPGRRAELAEIRQIGVVLLRYALSPRFQTD
jgi:5-amino-6-(5-phosphoribosylamino)uracil reductase